MVLFVLASFATATGFPKAEQSEAKLKSIKTSVARLRRTPRRESVLCDSAEVTLNPNLPQIPMPKAPNPKP